MQRHGRRFLPGRPTLQHRYSKCPTVETGGARPCGSKPQKWCGFQEPRRQRPRQIFWYSPRPGRSELTGYGHSQCGQCRPGLPNVFWGFPGLPVASFVAEGVGFEPTLRLPANTLSKRAPSATRPSLHAAARPAGPAARTIDAPACLARRKRPAPAASLASSRRGARCPDFRLTPPIPPHCCRPPQPHSGCDIGQTEEHPK